MIVTNRHTGAVRNGQGYGYRQNHKIARLTLWLRLTDKSAKKTSTCHGWWQISPLDSTIVSRMADKSVKLIKRDRHEWPINRPRVYQLWKDENLCLSILDLVHMSGN